MIRSRMGPLVIGSAGTEFHHMLSVTLNDRFRQSLVEYLSPRSGQAPSSSQTLG